jgi:undecaprenyl diphosphate synthase
MDGDRRWAKQKGLGVTAGHKQTVQVRIEELIKYCVELGIPYVTFWAWTTENWNRPSIEVKAMMQLFRWSLKHKAQKLIDNGARLRIIGDLSGFPQDIQDGVAAMIAQSAHNSRITVTFGLNYGGRNEIVRAVNKLLERGVSGPVDEALLSQQLDTAGIPDPDLMIRPGGQKRLSGLLPWQGVYSELYFTEVMMPDFGASELDIALADYASRKRTFGGGCFDEIKA